MAGVDDLFKSGLGGGLAVAVGAAVLAPVLVPALANVVKPVVKGAIKGGLVVYGWGRESFEETREFFEDTYAEARSELETAPGGEAGKETAGKGRSAGSGSRSGSSAQTA